MSVAYSAPGSEYSAASPQPSGASPYNGSEGAASAGTAFDGGGGFGSDAGSAASAMSAPPAAEIAMPVKIKTKYLCGDCRATTALGPSDSVQCHSCGYRVLYKMRTKALVQFQAR